jgi:hypothetical protein
MIDNTVNLLSGVVAIHYGDSRPETIQSNKEYLAAYGFETIHEFEDGSGAILKRKEDTEPFQHTKKEALTFIETMSMFLHPREKQTSRITYQIAPNLKCTATLKIEPKGKVQIYYSTYVEKSNWNPFTESEDPPSYTRNKRNYKPTPPVSFP